MNQRNAEIKQRASTPATNSRFGVAARSPGPMPHARWSDTLTFPSASLRHLRALRVLFVFLLLPLTACSTAPYPLHANQTVAQTREVVTANFPAGMPLNDVKVHLVELRIKPGDQILYPATATRPKVLLARLWEPGGFWVTESDQNIKWTDLSFLFDPADKLQRTLIYQDGNRYFQGRPAYPPSRPLEGGIRDWPGRPGPPIDPLEKAE